MGRTPPRPCGAGWRALRGRGAEGRRGGRGRGSAGEQLAQRRWRATSGSDSACTAEQRFQGACARGHPTRARRQEALQKLRPSHWPRTTSSRRTATILTMSSVASRAWTAGPPSSTSTISSSSSCRWHACSRGGPARGPPAEILHPDPQLPRWLLARRRQAPWPSTSRARPQC